MTRLRMASWVAAVTMWCLAAWGGEMPLRILAGPPGGQWSALGGALAGLLGDAGLPATCEVGGGVENLRLVGDGQADIGFTLYSFLGAAAAGEKELPDINLDNAVLLANLYPQVLYIIVRQEVADRHGLRALSDLLAVEEPLRFATLPRGTGSEFIFNMLLRNAYRSDYDKLAGQGWDISFQSYADITTEFLSGDLDVCAYTAGPGTYLIPRLEEASLDAILLPVDEDKLDMMTHQFMTITYVIRAGDYESVDHDVLTLGDYSCLVTQRALDEDTVHTINQTLWNNREALGEVSADILAMSPRFAVAGQSTVHPGSLRFWTSPEMLELKKQRRR